MAKTIVFDIETNGLILETTRMWIITTKCVETKEVNTFLENDPGWKTILEDADQIIGHNIAGFDLVILEKLFNFRIDLKKVVDTMIWSMVLDYKRFGMSGHSMAVWARVFGKEKQEHEDWSQFSEEMRQRNISDVDINEQIYLSLKKELEEKRAKRPMLETYIQAEVYAANWNGRCEMFGWPFDIDAALDLAERLEATKEKAVKALVPILGLKTVPKDMVKGIAAEKRPKWIKNGFYDQHTCNWFNVDPCSGYEGEERPIAGPFCRVEFKPLRLESVSDVKVFLFRHGWTPTEWNYHKETKKKTSPKITEDSLEFLGGSGKLYSDYAIASSRFNNLRTWIANVDKDGNLHGSYFTIGTPSMRARHNGIVNVPSGELNKDGTAVSAWGPDMRKLFSCKKGWKLVGCDSAGNQARGLAHDLKDAEFIDILLNGDIHQHNADIATKVLASMKITHVVPRPNAKRILYAFLFGASGGKLWSYIFKHNDSEKGGKFKKGFTEAVPGLLNLLGRLAKAYESTKIGGDPYIPSIVGNRIYVDSPHKMLVYRLQATEKITCSAALMLAVQKLEEENIPYVPLIFMHDEIDFMVPERYAQRASEIGEWAFKEGPKLFGIEIMDGNSKIGDNWFEIH